MHKAIPKKSVSLNKRIIDKNVIIVLASCIYGVCTNWGHLDRLMLTVKRFSIASTGKPLDEICVLPKIKETYLILPHEFFYLTIIP